MGEDFEKIGTFEGNFGKNFWEMWKKRQRSGKFLAKSEKMFIKFENFSTV